MFAAVGLTVRYGNGALAIEDVDLEVNPGEVVAVLGPNGAGKTTTLRAMTGFLRAETANIVRGSVRWRDTDVTGSEPHQMARLGIVAIPERDKIFPNLTVAENLAALRVRDKRVRDAQLEQVMQLFPFLEERLKDYAGLLSGGQQQMLAIGRGLLLKPEVLMIDEMTLGLHPSLHAPLFEAVRAVAATGTSVVVIDEGTTSALEHADSVYVISGGRVRATGPAADFEDADVLEGLYLAG